MSFHLRDGFFYERTPDGIHITYAQTVEGLPKVLGEITVTESEWASVMATTSARGENGDTWREAQAFLSKEKP